MIYFCIFIGEFYNFSSYLEVIDLYFYFSSICIFELKVHYLQTTYSETMLYLFFQFLCFVWNIQSAASNIITDKVELPSAICYLFQISFSLYMFLWNHCLVEAIYLCKQVQNCYLFVVNLAFYSVVNLFLIMFCALLFVNFQQRCYFHFLSAQYKVISMKVLNPNKQLVPQIRYVLLEDSTCNTCVNITISKKQNFPNSTQNSFTLLPSHFPSPLLPPVLYNCILSMQISFLFPTVAT